MNPAPALLFAGGGTGGHVLPGVATAEALLAMAPGSRCLFAVTDRDVRGPWSGGAAERIPLASPRLPRRPWQVPGFVVGSLRSFRDSLRAFRDHGIDGVVGLGGYGSVGPVLAALATGRPATVLEANVVPGAANRLLVRLGAAAAVSFEETVPLLPRRARVAVTGNPLREGVLRLRRDRARFGLDGEGPVLAVVGGSLGARGLNARVAAALPRLAAAGAQVLWATGAEDAPVMEAAARAAGVRAAILPFCDDMGLLYGTADLLLARAGGGLVAEAAALGIPAVFVPFPHHADRQQTRNAESLARHGAARVVEEDALTPDVFGREVVDLLRDGAARGRMAAAARRRGRPEAARLAARWVLERAGFDAPARPAAAGGARALREGMA